MNRNIPGKANSRADVLSRHPDYNQGTRDNEGIIVLPQHVFVKTTTISMEETSQDKETLQLWVDPHNLKQMTEYGTKREDKSSQDH